MIGLRGLGFGVVKCRVPGLFDEAGAFLSHTFGGLSFVLTYLRPEQS